MKKFECKFLIKKTPSYIAGPGGMKNQNVIPVCSLKIKNNGDTDTQVANPMNIEFEKTTGKSVAPPHVCPYYLDDKMDFSECSKFEPKK